MNQKKDRFTKYVDLYEKLVMTNAKRYVDHQTAEDVSQETFLKMLEHLEYLEDDTVKNWLVVVSGNIAKDYAKKGGSVDIYPMEPAEVMEHMDGRSESAEESFEREEKQKAARELLQTAYELLYEKNPYWYYIMVNACYGGMSSAQIGRTLHMSAGTVDVTKLRARNYLRKKLGKEYYELISSQFL
jgi:RNA polymerase sigma factor (sigma-70 family)